MSQIPAIVNRLNDRFPQFGFVPRNSLERTRMFETLAWMNSMVHPTFTHIFLPH